MKKTLYFSLIALVLQVILAYFIEARLSSEPYFMLIIGTGLYFSLFIIVGMRFLLNSLKGRPQAFVYTFMGYSGLKMFSSAIVILAFGLSFKTLLVELALGILLQYFLYTAFEVVSLRKALLKAEKK